MAGTSSLAAAEALAAELDAALAKSPAAALRALSASDTRESFTARVLARVAEGVPSSPRFAGQLIASALVVADDKCPDLARRLVPSVLEAARAAAPQSPSRAALARVVSFLVNPTGDRIVVVRENVARVLHVIVELGEGAPQDPPR